MEKYSRNTASTVNRDEIAHNLHSFSGGDTMPSEVLSLLETIRTVLTNIDLFLFYRISIQRT